jgi:superfamily II DNA or RNA helicase
MPDIEEFLSKRVRSERLRDVLAKMGKEVPPGRTKEPLVVAVTAAAIGSPREFVGALFQGELAALAQVLGALPIGRRNEDYIDAILSAWDGPPTDRSPDVASRPSWLRDVGRRDLFTTGIGRAHGLSELRIVPTRPGHQDQVSLFDFYRRLRDPELRRCTFVSYNSNAGFLERLLEAGGEALVASAIDVAKRSEGAQPAFTIVLDAEHHGLAEGRAGRSLVAMARQGTVDLRLGPLDRRMHAKVYAFQFVGGSDLDDEPLRRLEALLGSSNLTSSGFGTNPSANIEANVWFSADSWWIDEPAWHLGLRLLDWIDELVDLSRRLTDADLARFPSEPAVERKIACKREFDTYREAILKLLAEQIAARGRTAWSLYDPSAIPHLPDHQLVPVIRSMGARLGGFLLFDEVGLGKTIETGLILSRERRRRREAPTDHDTGRKEAIIVAPPALHEQWAAELSQKFGIEAEVFGAGHRRRRENELRSHDDDVDDGDYWRCTPAQVLITSPEIVRNERGYFPAFDVVIVDECHRAQGEQTFDAIEELGLDARLRIFASGTPIQNEIADLWVPAGLAFPEAIADQEVDFVAQFGGLTEPELQLLQQLVAPITARSYRRALIDAGHIKPRILIDQSYSLDEQEAAAYRGIRALRDEYRKRRGHGSNWAFITLEQTFLSSPYAFVSVASRVLGEQTGVDPEFEREVRSDDTSYEFLRRGPARRRLSALREAIVEHASASAAPSRKEDSLLRLLRDPGLHGQRVLLFTRFRATQSRLVRLLRDAGFPGDARTIHGGSSRRERRETFDWFTRETTARRPPGWAAGVLICTDVAAEGLNLQAACSALVNYDLPWNPQRIEQRIGRLQRWGQKERVRVFNFFATADGMTTMDQRVLDVCRTKFRMADEVLGASERLFEIDEERFRSLLDDDDDDLPPESALADRAARSLDRVLSQPRDAEYVRAVQHGRRLDERYRAMVRSFFERATLGAEEEGASEGHLLETVRASLLKGHVAILQRASSGSRPLSGFSFAVGVRVVVEVAVSDEPADGDEAREEDWLLEEEVPCFWLVTPGQSLTDWSEGFPQEGFFEKLPSEAEPLVGREVVEYLREKKRSLVEAEADAAPIAVWRDGAPPSVLAALEAVEQAARAMLAGRVDPLRREWDAARARTVEQVGISLARLEALRRKSSSSSMREALQAVQGERYAFRTDVLVTQFLLILS